MKRVFIALWPDELTRQKIVQIMSALDEKGLKWVKANNLHITLLYIGTVDNTLYACIENVVREISAKPLSIEFDQLRHWRKAKLLCLCSCRPPIEIIKLANTLHDKIARYGIELDAREYCPHVTLARQVRCNPQLQLAPLIWRANTFSLVESVAQANGVDYQVLRTWPLS